MHQRKDWETGWDINRPRWAYCLQCTSKPLFEHAERKGWLNSQSTGSHTFIANCTLDRLEEESGLQFSGLELRACYDRDIEKIFSAIVLWKDNVPETDEDRKVVGKLVDHLKEQVGLDPGLEPKWCLLNYLYELERGGIDEYGKPESLIKFT